MRGHEHHSPPESAAVPERAAQHRRANGFQVRDGVVADPPAIKRRLGVPGMESACAREPFTLMAFTRAGAISSFSHLPPVRSQP